MTVPDLPPHNIDAEKSVLGAVLLDDRHLDAATVEVGLRAEHFYDRKLGHVFEAMLQLKGADRGVDHLTVAEALRTAGHLEDVGGAAAVEELAAWVPASGNAKEYARIIRDLAKRRQIAQAAGAVLSSAYGREHTTDEIVEQAERTILKAADDERRQPVTPIAKALESQIDEIGHRATADGALTGTPTGFRDLDALTGGLQPGSLNILAARPGMGKSTLVMNIAEAAALAGHGVVIFSLEMSDGELCDRLIAAAARVRGEHIRFGKVTDREWPKVLDACSRLSDTRMFLDDSGDTGILDIRAKARRLHHGPDGPLGLVIVDYLQLMRPDERTANRVEQVGQMSRGLKSLAKELSVPVVALSQLSRAIEQRADKAPMLSDLRESGQIEADADVIMFINRDEKNFPETSTRPGEADIIIAKNRHGPVDKVVLAFQEDYPAFINYARHPFPG